MPTWHFMNHVKQSPNGQDSYGEFDGTIVNVLDRPKQSDCSSKNSVNVYPNTQSLAKPNTE